MKDNLYKPILLGHIIPMIPFNYSAYNIIHQLFSFSLSFPKTEAP